MNTLRERLHIRKEQRRREREFLLRVEWIAYDDTNSVFDDVYDMPGERVYLPPFTLPVMWVIDLDNEELLEDGGRAQRKGVRLTAASESFTERGLFIPDPLSHEPQARFNDLFRYGGFTYEVTEFDAKGHVGYPERDTVITVTGMRRLAGSDAPYDTDPDGAV